MMATAEQWRERIRGMKSAGEICDAAIREVYTAEEIRNLLDGYVLYMTLDYTAENLTVDEATRRARNNLSNIGMLGYDRAQDLRLRCLIDDVE